jgi:hypothetical protein
LPDLRYLVAIILAKNAKINHAQLYKAFLDHDQLRGSAGYPLMTAHDVLLLSGTWEIGGLKADKKIQWVVTSAQAK